MRDAGDVPGTNSSGPATVPDPERDTARRRDAHAVRADDRDVALGRARRDARRDRAPLGAGFGAEPGHHDRAHAGRDPSSNAASARVWPTSRKAHSGVSGRAVSDGKHSRPSTWADSG